MKVVVVENPDRTRTARLVLRARLKLTLRSGLGWRSGHPATALRTHWGYDHLKPRDYDGIYAAVSNDLGLNPEWRAT